jgi:hypothetical protein
VFPNVGRMAADFRAVFEHVQALIAEQMAPQPAEGMNAQDDRRPALVVERMRQMVQLRNLGLVSPEEYEAKRTELLGQL